MAMTLRPQRTIVSVVFRKGIGYLLKKAVSPVGSFFSNSYLCNIIISSVYVSRTIKCDQI